MAIPSLSAAQIADFLRDGYVIVRGLFDTEEMNIMRTAAKADAALKSNAYEVADGKGAAIKLALWNKAGEDIYGAVSRSPRIVDAMEQLLGDEVYHYHSKMSIKEPYTGGAWNWHQDYGYGTRMAACFRIWRVHLSQWTRTRERMVACKCFAVHTRWDESSTANSATKPAPTRTC
jgi:hypothetical protein